MGIKISGLWIYPVKSCAGLSLNSFKLDRWGPIGDRRWMVVNRNGVFLTQRQHPKMALVKPAPHREGLTLSAPGAPDLSISAKGTSGVRVRVWKDEVSALDAGDEAAAWMTRFLKTPCRLVRMDPEAHSRPKGASFADDYPLLVISEASLEDLNSRLPEPLPMNRFRPNIVLSGCAPYAEDSWKRIRIGGVTLRALKPCSRCAITTINQKTLAAGPEPLRTLARYRRTGSSVFFGQNMAHESPGILEAGAPIEIL